MGAPMGGTPMLRQIAAILTTVGGGRVRHSAADTHTRARAIVCSTIQCGADTETIRKALCRDNLGRANRPLGAVLDRVAAWKS